jgi:uncharacterized protein YbaP (TraB family)
MKKYTAILLFLPILCLAQLPKTLFWEISGNGLKQTSFLYGTMHSVCVDNMNIVPSAKKAILNSQVLYVEIYIEKPIDQYKSMLTSLNPKGRNIETYFNKSEIKKLDRLIQKKLNLRLYNYQLLKPQAFNNLIYSIALPCKLTSYEEEILKIAKSGNLKIASLETFDAHAKVPIRKDLDYIADIKNFLSNPRKNTYTSSFLESKRQYDSKDIQKMYENFSLRMDDKSYHQMVIVDRNLAWIPIIEKSVKENKCFFAFGAAHLAGDVGIINLLKEKGYSVKPIFY